MPKVVNKVVYGSTTIVDMTDADATANDIAMGKTAYIADGTKATGTLVVACAAQSEDCDIYLVMNGEYSFQTDGSGSVSFGPVSSS